VTIESESRKTGRQAGDVGDVRRRRRNPGAVSPTPRLLAARIASLDFWRAGLVDHPTLDVFLLVSLLVLLVISRRMAFPSTIWDQDEANFALAVLHFDPLHNQPHAPFFPLWVALGKLARMAAPSIRVEDALRVVGVLVSILIFFPLRSLWEVLLSRGEATAAAALFVFMPAPWLLSGRAYSEPAATAALIAGVALWLEPDVPRRNLIAGGIALAASVLIRPQWVLLVIPLTLLRLVRSRNAADRALILGPPIALGLGTAAILIRIAGGTAPLLAAVEHHRRYIARAGEGFSWSFTDFGLNRALGGLIPGTLWMAAALAGAVVLFRRKATRRGTEILVGLVLLPQILQLLLAQNPTLPRYALPLLALSCGLVVAGLGSVMRNGRTVAVAVGLAVIASSVAVVPSLQRYRRPSPVMAAFHALDTKGPGELTACDRRLVAFVTLLDRTGRLRTPIVWDYRIELGMFTRPFDADTTAVFTGDDVPWVANAAEIDHFSCENELLRRVATPKFLDLTVIQGCALVRPARPSITWEQLQSGAVIPVRAR